jgi:hypothetical protein
MTMTVLPGSRPCALAVGQAAVVEHLQQHVEHVVVRLLDFVEQDHAVRTAANARLGQIAAFLVAHIAGGAPIRRLTRNASP